MTRGDGMPTKETLKKISHAVERVARELGAGQAHATQRLTLPEFVTYAMHELKVAGNEEPAAAVRRMKALERNVDGVLGQLKKLNAEDADSASIGVEVETAWAPAKADGDDPIEDLTVFTDQSSTERSLTADAATGTGSYASNLGAVAKGLARLKES